MGKKIGFFKAYGKMWKNTFNYYAKANQREYWIPFFFNLFLALVDAVILIATKGEGKSASILPILLTVYLAVSILPFISLTVRRLRDTGRKGWYTLLLLFVGIGTVIVLVWCTGAGLFDAAANSNVCVYGPPEMFE